MTLLRIESHIGLRRTSNCWEHFMVPPFLRQVGFHGSDQRAGELLVEDDLRAIEEVGRRQLRRGCDGKTVALARIESALLEFLTWPTVRMRWMPGLLEASEP